jgi:flagellar protein FlaG
MNIGNVSRPAPGSATEGSDKRPDPAAAGDRARSSASPASDAPARAGPSPQAATIQPDTAGKPSMPEISRASMEKLVEAFKGQVSIEKRSLSFVIDQELDRTIVKVIDPATDEVVRQIPSEELLRFAQALRELSENIDTGITDGAGAGLLIQEQA